MKSKLTVDYATAWLMGIDPVATGAQLKQHRIANNLTQEELSGILADGGDPASRVSISMWESGKKLPSLSHLVFLRELYGCTLDELICTYRQSEREAGDGDQPVVFSFISFFERCRIHSCSAFLRFFVSFCKVNCWYIVNSGRRRYTLAMITTGGRAAAAKLHTNWKRKEEQP